MVKYLFDIFYLCVVMFLNLGHQLPKARHVVMVVAGISKNVQNFEFDVKASAACK